MEELAAANLSWLRPRLEARPPRDPWLRELLAWLWLRDLQAPEEVLSWVVRVSPARTVLHLPAASSPPARSGALLEQGAAAGDDRLRLPADGLLLKIYHPRRRTEAWRRMFSRAPALREFERWNLLAWRIGVVPEAAAQQCTRRLGVYARPWWSGSPAAECLPAAAAAVGSGLATLHRQRWSDRDLDAGDLLFVHGSAGETAAPEDLGVLVPVDLGHARVAALPLAAEIPQRDLVRLLMSLPTAVAEASAADLCAHYSRAAEEEIPSPGALLQQAARRGGKRLLKRSARCLRPVSDFDAGPGWARRRFVRVSSPGPSPDAVLLKQGRRGSVLREPGSREDGRRENWPRDGGAGGQRVWKSYQRPGTVQRLRRLLGWSPGRRAYRLLYLLELGQIAAVPALGWWADQDGEWLLRGWVDGSPASAADADALLDWLLQLHRLGLGHRDLKPANFVVTPQHELVLIDADGLAVEGPDGARDLARLLAEFPAGSVQEKALADKYQAACGAFNPRQRRRLQRLSADLRARLALQPAAPAPPSSEPAP